MSIISKFTKEEIKSYINNSNSIHEVLTKIGYKADTGTGNRRTFFKFVKENNLEKDLNELKKRISKNRIENLSKYNYKKLSNEKIFTKNSTFSRNHLKQRIIKENLLEYKCAFCGNKGKWNKKPMILQLDHINGINDDNRLENLRFLCPNCHSQTETYAGKNKIGPID